jgi:elongation factor G
VYQDVREHLTPKAIPVEVPIGSGESFRGIVNLFSDRAHFYTPGTQTASTRRATVPADLQATVDRYYAELIETIAATDDTLLEHYLEGDTITRDEAIHALKQAMLRGELYPLFCGAPTLTYGIRALLTKVVELLPSPQERPAEIAEGRGGTTVELRGLNSDPFCALVFKTTSEPHVGELSFFRVFGGSVRNGDEVGNATRDKAEKLSHLSVPQGRERLEVEELRAGDIGVVAKLRDTHTNDTLAAPAHPLILEGVRFPSRTSPSRWRAPRAATRTSSRWACTSCTRKTPASPPSTTPSWARPSPAAWASSTWRCSWSGSSARRGSASWCARRASPTARRSERSRGPRAAQEADGRARPVRRRARAHQAAQPRRRLPLHRRGGGRRHPRQVHPRRGQGRAGGGRARRARRLPVVDFEAEVYFGSYHTVDSSEAAFKVAGSLAFQEAASRAEPVILEPVMAVEVITPDEFLGDVIGDLNQRRGHILGIEPAGRAQRLRATGAAGRAVQVLHRPALPHPGPRHPHPRLPRVRGSPRARGAKAGGGDQEGTRGAAGGAVAAAETAGLTRRRRDAEETRVRSRHEARREWSPRLVSFPCLSRDVIAVDDEAAT